MTDPGRHLGAAARPARLAHLAILVAVLVALFPRALLRGEVFYERDLGFDWITQVDSLARCRSLRSWPLWDNAVGFGQPLLADPSAQVLYPPTWLHLGLRPWTYYVVYVAGHALLAGIGAAALARVLGASAPAAVTAGALFMASGPFLSMANLYHHFAGAAWMPWVVLGARRLADAPRLRAALLWTLLLALQLLAGSADMCMAAQLFAAALVGHRLLQRDVPGGRARLAGLAAMSVFLAAALAAAQWLPTLEQAERSLRWDMPGAMRTAWSVTPLSLLRVALDAPLWDVPLAPAAQAALEPWGDAFLRSYYLGLPQLALAATALAAAAGGTRRVLAGTALGATLFALGDAVPFHRLLVTALPVLGVSRYPSKAMVLAALAIALLAGLGVDAWPLPAAGRRWRLLVVAPLAAATVAAAVVAVGAAGGWGARLMPAGAPREQVDEVLAPVTRHLVAGACAAAAVLALALARRRGVLVGAVAVATLVVAAEDVNRTTRRRLLDLRPPILDAVSPGSTPRPLGEPRVYVFEYLHDPARSRRYLHRSEPYPLRLPPGMPLRDAQVLSQHLYPFPPSAARWGFEGSFEVDFRGTYPAYLAELSRLLEAAEGTPLHAWLLRMGAVSHVLALHSEGLSDLVPVATEPTLYPEPARAFRVVGPRPRAYLVSGARPGAAASTLARAAADLDLEREALIADLPARVPPDPLFRGEVVSLEMRPDRVRAETEATAASWLVVVDAFDPGWRASVDGAQAGLQRANLAFRAVRVPPGRHRVEMVYRPAGVRAGLAVSLLALLAVALLAYASTRSS